MATGVGRGWTVSDEPPDTEFGPGGYLPQKAAKRARKIVLRAELGLQWVIAAVVAAVLLLAAGVLWLLAGDGVPDGYEPVVPAVSVAEPGAAASTNAEFLALNDQGRVRVYAMVSPSLTFCPATGNLEARVGDEIHVWTTTGRSLDGFEPLPQFASRVVDAIVYVDPRTPLPAVRGRVEQVEPFCLD